ncbi:MAG TPA: Gfo/Idh/MocA family oxidoreductase [Bryobacteraceae bacterium]|nr:Gfo/Idh/MocA family oxidoreductase [Bryobacteraceae bacterium]
MQREDRRSFMKHAGVRSAVAAGSLFQWNPRAKGANERVVVALIGGRNQGRGVATRMIEQGAEIKTFCDLDDEVLRKVGAELGKAQNKSVSTVKDFRRVLDDKDIDGVIIATPDHWHTHIALPGCQAGKDLYLEKPVSQTIHEGHLIRDAARKYNRIVQVGTQRRSAEYCKSAIEFVASGKLGKICLVKAWHSQIRESIGKPPDGSPPASIDYDVWLGPAPKRPFNPNRFHYNWRFFWDYGNAEIGNQGVHVLDLAMWGIQSIRGISRCLPGRVSSNGGIYWLGDAKEVPDTQVVTYDYGDFMLVWELRSFTKGRPLEGLQYGAAFYGTEGSLVIGGSSWTAFNKDGAAERTVEDSGGSHEKRFLDAVRSRERPNADIEIGRLSTTLCHLGNISHRLRRDVVFDPSTETFGDDKAANARLTKEYRSPYELPKV